MRAFVRAIRRVGKVLIIKSHGRGIWAEFLSCIITATTHHISCVSFYRARLVDALVFIELWIGFLEILALSHTLRREDFLILLVTSRYGNFFQFSRSNLSL